MLLELTWSQNLFTCALCYFISFINWKLWLLTTCWSFQKKMIMKSGRDWCNMIIETHNCTSHSPTSRSCGSFQKNNKSIKSTGVVKLPKVITVEKCVWTDWKRRGTIIEILVGVKMKYMTKSRYKYLTKKE